MATDTTAANTPAAPDTQASDYSTVKRARTPRIDPEATIAPTCMIWCMFIGIGLLVLIVVIWGISNIGTILR
jgi:hypothetical protein